MKVYVLQRECSDYYCGCGGGHIHGIFLTEAEARERATDFFDNVTEVTIGEEKQWT